MGSATALVLTGGRMVHALWTKASSTAVTVFTDTSGQPVLLTPGQTWVQALA